MLTGVAFSRGPLLEGLVEMRDWLEVIDLEKLIDSEPEIDSEEPDFDVRVSNEVIEVEKEADIEAPGYIDLTADVGFANGSELVDDETLVDDAILDELVNGPWLAVNEAPVDISELEEDAKSDI